VFLPRVHLDDHDAWFVPYTGMADRVYVCFGGDRACRRFGLLFGQERVFERRVVDRSWPRRTVLDGNVESKIVPSL
jgi:hypothetical protein